MAGVTGLGNTSTPNEAQSSNNEAPKTGERERNSILTVEVLAMGDGSVTTEGAVGVDLTGDADPDDRKKKKKPAR